MSGGSLKDLLRSLSVALSAPHPLYPPSEDVLSAVQAYINRHTDYDEHECQRLHEELLTLHDLKVHGYPDRLAVFLACFRHLRPAIIGVERLLKWWEILVKPTFDSMGQAKAVVADARAIVLSVIAYEDEDDPTGQKAEGSSVFTDKLFEILLERTRITSADKNAGAKDEQKHRFVSANVEALLLAYGKRRPKAFLRKIDTFVVQKECRLQILGLLCSYVRLQGPHLYYVLQTPLFEHLLQCMENDTSTTVVSLALTIVIMFMPHLCNSLGPYLPRLFVIYTRVLCWDKFGVVRLEVGGGFDAYSRTASPLSAHRLDTPPKSPAWQKLDSSFETASSTTPDVSDYFSFLYGLYPINFLGFIREPYKFLERGKYKDIDQLDIDEETIRQRTEPYRQQHILHPNFLTLTAETELSDPSRWMKVEPADVTAQCIGLVNNSTPSILTHPPEGPKPINIVPGSMVPTEDIPTESLLSQDHDENNYDTDSTSAISPRNGVYGEVMGLFNRSNSDYNSRDPKSPDSPTIPTALDPSEEARLQDMLNLQEQLHASLHDSIKQDHLPTPPPTTSLPHPPGPPPTYPGSATASPRLGSYVHSLSQDNIPRSPALRPASSDTQGTIAYLQREVMLLKNDLNFERYLKQQHLSHIGHLQRKHIKESTAEAETQNLINTNKTLKAKLEEAKKAYSTLRQETLKSKNQAKKWEGELNTKIRTLREEQKAWRQDEEATKKALDSARGEADHLRKLLAESEAEGLRLRQKLQSLNSEMEEVNKLRNFVDHLSKKVGEYQSRADEYEMQRHNVDAALGQSERLKMRLQSKDQEIVKMKRAYETKVKEMESRLNSASTPIPQSPGPGFQGMIDNALAVANSRLVSLKKAYSHLLTKYTDLEIKYMELQAQQEMDGMGMSTSGSQQFHHYSSDNEHNSRAVSRNGPPRYQQSDDSMSPVNSFTENSMTGNNYHAQGDQRNHSVSSSSGYRSNYSFEGYGQMSPDSITAADFPFPKQSRSGQPLRHSPSIPEGFSTHSTPQYSTNNANYGTAPHERPESAHPSLHTIQASSTSQSDDTQSLKTVTSTTSSEKKRREKIKPQSEVRVRGRGGVQNVGKKVKDKDKDKDKDENGEEKKKKKSRFQGTPLANIRGFGGA